MSVRTSKHELVYDQVLELIHGLPVGEAIPAERVLAGQLDVARMTLRRAIDDLVREGYLERQHGRGTFVARPKVSQPLSATSFSEDMRRRGFEPGGRTLSFALVTAGARIGRRLEVSPSEPVLKIVRLRLADDEPMAIEVLHTPEALVPGLTATDLEDASFYTLLDERYGLWIAAGIQTVEPTVTSPEESDELRVPLHSPAFLFERVSRAENGRILEYVRSVYRGDRYQIVAELMPPKPRPGAQGVGRRPRQASP